MEKRELTLDETLRILIEQQNDAYALETKNIDHMLTLLDNLIERTEALQSQSIDDKVLLGSLVEVKQDCGNGKIVNETYYLGLDSDAETVSILSPVGYSIFGASVGETVSVNVRGNLMTATIVSKNKLLSTEKEVSKSYEKSLV